MGKLSFKIYFGIYDYFTGTILTYGNESFSLRNWETLIIYLTMSDKKWNYFSLSSEECFNIFRSEFINVNKKKFVGRKGKDHHAKNAWNFTVKRLVIKKLGYQGIAITYGPFSPFFSFNFQHSLYSGFHVFFGLVGLRGFGHPDAGVGNFEGYFLFMWRVSGRGKKHILPMRGWRSNRRIVRMSCHPTRPSILKSPSV